MEIGETQIVQDSCESWSAILISLFNIQFVPLVMQCVYLLSTDNKQLEKLLRNGNKVFLIPKLDSQDKASQNGT